MKLETMAEHNIVVFGGDHCGPEVSLLSELFTFDVGEEREANCGDLDRSLPRESRYESNSLATHAEGHI